MRNKPEVAVATMISTHLTTSTRIKHRIHTGMKILKEYPAHKQCCSSIPQS